MFVAEIDQQLIIPVLRSYLKFYTTMPVSKLAAFMEIVSLLSCTSVALIKLDGLLFEKRNAISHWH